MTNLVSKITAKTVLRIAAAAGLGLGLTGCVYDGGLGLGYASDNYGYNNSGGYDCDPYSPFDSYYYCDFRYGFGNIGYGGGWYNNYYYPGQGFFVFDSYGRRFNMQRDYQRYWGQRRYEWYRGRNNGGGYPRGNGYNGHHGGWSDDDRRPPRDNRDYDRGDGKGRDNDRDRDRDNRGGNHGGNGGGNGNGGGGFGSRVRDAVLNQAAGNPATGSQFVSPQAIESPASVPPVPEYSAPAPSAFAVEQPEQPRPEPREASPDQFGKAQRQAEEKDD